MAPQTRAEGVKFADDTKPELEINDTRKVYGGKQKRKDPLRFSSSVQTDEVEKQQLTYKDEGTDAFNPEDTPSTFFTILSWTWFVLSWIGIGIFRARWWIIAAMVIGVIPYVALANHAADYKDELISQRALHKKVCRYKAAWKNSRMDCAYARDFMAKTRVWWCIEEMFRVHVEKRLASVLGEKDTIWGYLWVPLITILGITLAIFRQISACFFG